MMVCCNVNESPAESESDDESLPDCEVALEFYLRYVPFEVLGRGLSYVVRR